MFWRYCPCFGSSSSNELDGPSGGGQAPKELDFGHLRLQDVPSEVFQRERTLEELYLGNNMIKDLPRQLFHCTGLKVLDLSDNDITTLPPAIASLINLERLDLSKNGILDIPECIRICSGLKRLDVSVNPLERLPEGFTQLLNLQELYLNDTFLEYLPANFGRLNKLRVLELRENHLKTLPKSLNRLTELRKLDVGQNELVELPEVVGSLYNLVELWCDSNRLKFIPEFIGNLKKLEYIDASCNQISEISEMIAYCESLNDITFTNNKLTALPESMTNLRRLITLRVDENDLTALPSGLGTWTCLEELIISCNQIKSLPQNIGFIRTLHTLIADYNDLVKLPSTIGSCLSLRLLAFSNNLIEYLPNEIGRLANLQVLNLAGNKLRYLPLSTAKLVSLKALWLSETQAKPLMTLQQEMTADGEKVLTCFLLPQQELDCQFNQSQTFTNHTDDEAISPTEPSRQAIKFSGENGEMLGEDDGTASNLMRKATPYPKELRSYARHAKNLALSKRRDSDLRTDLVDGEGSVQAVAGNSPQIQMAQYKNESTMIAGQAMREATFVKPQLSNLRDSSRSTESNNSTDVSAAIADINSINVGEFIGNMQVNPCHSFSFSFAEANQMSDGTKMMQPSHPIAATKYISDDSKLKHTSEPSYVNGGIAANAAPLNDSFGGISLDSSINRVKSRKPVCLTMNDRNSFEMEADVKAMLNLADESMVVHPGADTSRMTFANTSFDESFSYAEINHSNGFVQKREADCNSASSVTSQYASSDSDRTRSSRRSSYASATRLNSTLEQQGNSVMSRDQILNSRNMVHGRNGGPPHLNGRPPLPTLIGGIRSQTFQSNIRTSLFKSTKQDSKQSDSSNISDNSSHTSSSASSSVKKFKEHDINAHTFPVIIVKRSDDLDFTICSDINQATGEQIVRVSSIKLHGAASSVLKVGDVLLRIDDIDLNNVDFSTAQAILLSTGHTVSLLISRPAA